MTLSGLWPLGTQTTLLCLELCPQHLELSLARHWHTINVFAGRMEVASLIITNSLGFPTDRPVPARTHPFYQLTWRLSGL